MENRSISTGRGIAAAVFRIIAGIELPREGFGSRPGAGRRYDVVVAVAALADRPVKNGYFRAKYLHPAGRIAGDQIVPDFVPPGVPHVDPIQSVAGRDRFAFDIVRRPAASRIRTDVVAGDQIIRARDVNPVVGEPQDIRKRPS